MKSIKKFTLSKNGTQWVPSVDAQELSVDELCLSFKKTVALLARGINRRRLSGASLKYHPPLLVE